ncbi:MAG: hypothetical protein PUK66_07230 [Bacteroidales bacterium]|uniref:hypothetical protein n=1 Tax=Porphyromonas sp. TaxID=1924944 RepID=UPI00297014D2|nr:hypothetical protein [Porphyromonas sp.]MDD7438604.1 hypothetical protein [Bacteroidales bacterium]MDY3067860.1 hypothetical protein [Porphyromonas sp.]
MEYYSGQLCISYEELTGGDHPLVKAGTLKSMQYRHQIKQMRKGYGKGVTALYAYESLPKGVREEFERRYGDPVSLIPKPGERYYVEDAMARAFYESYTYCKNGEMVTLPDRIREEYVVNASVANMLLERLADLTSLSNKLGNRRRDLWRVMVDYSEALKIKYKHTLPRSEGRLRTKILEYKKEGYAALISGKMGNSNTLKITEEAGEFIVGLKRCKYPRSYNNADILEAYNAIAESKGWKPIESLQSITAYLESSAVRPMWLEQKVGHIKSNTQLGRKMRTKMPEYRNSLWYGDGTKHNIFVASDTAKCGYETLDVYVVIDAMSEVILSSVFGKENSDTQYHAYREALLFTKERPYELVVDNQSGHTKNEREGFFKRLAMNYRTTSAYRPSGKSVEQLFGRIQQQFLSRMPFYTGQNMTAKGDYALPNTEWIRANRHLMPTEQEVRAQWQEVVEAWNNSAHPNGKGSRLEVYAANANPALHPLTELEMVELLWREKTRPIKYTNSGIEIEVQGKRYAFEVYNEDGYPDLKFVQHNVGAEFIVRYDPADPSSRIALYHKEVNGDLRFVRMARPYWRIARAMQDQDEREVARIHGQLQREKAARMELIARNQAIDLRQGNIHDIPMPVPGLTKDENQAIRMRAYQLAGASGEVQTMDDAQRERARKIRIEIGEEQKALSNLTAAEMYELNSKVDTHRKVVDGI